MAVSETRRDSTRLRFRRGWAPVFASEAATHRLPLEVNRPTGMVLQSDVWLDVTIADGWNVAYRIVPQDGRAIIAELRLYPEEKGALKDVRLWLGDMPGIAPSYLGKLVPPGGVTATLARKLRVGYDVKSHDLILAHLTATPHGRKWLDENGLTPSPRRPDGSTGARRGRRASLSTAKDYRDIEKRYSQLSREGRAALAKELGLTANGLRTRVRRAREDFGFHARVPRPDRKRS